jgi:hypothetical protein
MTAGLVAGATSPDMVPALARHRRLNGQENRRIDYLETALIKWGVATLDYTAVQPGDTDYTEGVAITGNTQPSRLKIQLYDGNNMGKQRVQAVVALLQKLGVAVARYGLDTGADGKPVMSVGYDAKTYDGTSD